MSSNPSARGSQPSVRDSNPSARDASQPSVREVAQPSVRDATQPSVRSSKPGQSPKQRDLEASQDSHPADIQEEDKYEEDFDQNPQDSSIAPAPPQYEEEKTKIENDDPRKTFVTQPHHEEQPEHPPFVLHDLLFPGGKIAKLCKIPDPKAPHFRLTEVLKRFKLTEPNPVILLSGNESDVRSRLLIGIVRAAFNTDAVIVDNAMKSGIELACYKKKVKLIGVCPEDIIVYPTKQSTGDRLGEVTPGHSHIFTLGTKGDRRGWNSVLGTKFDLIERLRKGRGGADSYVCRVVNVLVGDNTNCLAEVEMVLKSGWPVIVLEISPLGQQIRNFLNGDAHNLPDTFKKALRNGRVFLFPESGSAEHLASAVHLHLAISLQQQY